MDATRTFEQSELTNKILLALSYASVSIKEGLSDNDELEFAEDLDKLYHKIKNEKLDVRLVSREY